MFIKKLAIQNFRNLKSSVIEPARLNIFVGPNNSGKSSILAAVEWALTGRNLWTDRAGRGAGDLISREARECRVWLELAGLGGVVRAMPPHSLAVGKSNSIQESQAAIYHYLGADEQLIRLALNAGAFSNLPPAEQKTFLFALCGISCTAATITAATEQYLCGIGLSRDRAGEAAAKVTALLPAGFGGDPAILEGMEKRAREERRGIKKDLERAKSALAAMAPPVLPEGLEPSDKEAVAGQLAELESEKNELLKAYGVRQAAKKNIALCRAKIEQLTAEITRLGEARTALAREAAGTAATGNPGACKGRPELAAELNGAKERLEQLALTAAELDRKLSALQTSNRNRRAVLEKLQSFDGQCPLAPRLIACRMSDNEVAELAGQLAVENQADSPHINGLKDYLQKVQVEKLELQRRIRLLEQALARLDNAERELTSLAAALERAQSELDSARLEEAGWEETLRKGGADPEEIDRLQGRIDRGREFLRRLEVAEHGCGQADRLQQDLQVLEQELAVAELMVGALGPNGIRKSLLGDRLAGFTREINNMLAACTEGLYRLEWQEDFNPLITRKRQPLPLKLLSRSEQFRVSIALQAAIAKLTGLNFLAVDEVDMLDQDNRDLLTCSLLNVMDQFDQIMLFSTVGDVQPRNPGLPGVKMFWVEDGRISELGSSASNPAGRESTGFSVFQ
ncbi:chromosome segregation protein [Sporotomaculum syntrophicum]|uniref:Nuclease SbcCD subunit C n=1 Tax=Sporotomaculum syntrophicum TaxID=182264 RepID=A0A9D2WPY6_9FIRM|nr:AAA family ATPase [Sporotomaculum syntrophicum]KAF1084948.1 chromosome segregation protein [Sporotomaculum syntrophicum]